jgi:hypothetical protein
MLSSKWLKTGQEAADVLKSAGNPIDLSPGGREGHERYSVPGSAAILDQEQLGGSEAVTNPWKLTLAKDGIKRCALWKNARGIMHGYLEGWTRPVDSPPALFFPKRARADHGS